MAGGRGSRMSELYGHDTKNSKYNTREKLLLPIITKTKKPTRVIGHVIDAMMRCDTINRIYAIVSEANAPHTRQAIADQYHDTIDMVESSGAGYSEDIGHALKHISKREKATTDPYERGAIIAPGDMPYVDANIISQISSHYAKDIWTAIVITKEYADMWESSFAYQEAIPVDKRHHDTTDKLHCYYTGISLVDPLLVASHHNGKKKIAQRHVILNDHRIVHSLNTPNDYEKYMQKAGLL